MNNDNKNNNNIDTEETNNVENLVETKPGEFASTRSSLQIPRRLFHMGCGLGVSLIYLNYFSQERAVYIVGAIACIVYILEQIRLSYPEIIHRHAFFTKYLLRAEEQLKETASLPYIIAILLAIITFPKTIAVTAILVLAIGDPMSAIIGIRFGKHKIAQGKSVEGSLAFFIATLLITLVMFYTQTTGTSFWMLLLFAIITAIVETGFELIPLKLDDNLTIPITMGFNLLIFSTFFQISVGG